MLWRTILEVSIGGTLSIVAIYFRLRWNEAAEEKKELDRRMKRDKKGAYLAFTDILFDQFSGGGELGETMRNWAASIVMHASDEVVNSFIETKEVSTPPQQESGTGDVSEQDKKMVRLLGRILIEMRQDTYGEDTELTKDDMIKLFITDYHKVVEG